jgi:hypothetical protein
MHLLQASQRDCLIETYQDDLSLDRLVPARYDEVQGFSQYADSCNQDAMADVEEQIRHFIAVHVSFAADRFLQKHQGILQPLIVIHC